MAPHVHPRLTVNASSVLGPAVMFTFHQLYSLGPHPYLSCFIRLLLFSVSRPCDKDLGHFSNIRYDFSYRAVMF